MSYPNTKFGFPTRRVKNKQTNKNHVSISFVALLTKTKWKLLVSVLIVIICAVLLVDECGFSLCH